MSTQLKNPTVIADVVSVQGRILPRYTCQRCGKAWTPKVKPGEKITERMRKCGKCS